MSTPSGCHSETVSLWHYSLRQYRHHQQQLLQLQDDRGLDVCVLLTLAYCADHHCALEVSSLEQPESLRLALLTKRLRAYRRASTATKVYHQAKGLEVEVEKVYLLWLSTQICQHSNTDLATFEDSWNLNRGTLAPLLSSLRQRAQAANGRAV